MPKEIISFFGDQISILKIFCVSGSSDAPWKVMTFFNLLVSEILRRHLEVMSFFSKSTSLLEEVHFLLDFQALLRRGLLRC